MKAGDLIHRITIQSRVEVVDPDSGYREWVWQDKIANEPAQWLAGPGREYLASESTRSEVEGRFVIRWSPEARLIKAKDRILWDGRVMAIKAPPLVDETARSSLMLMVGEFDGGDAS